jgi:hypothetical protein
MIEVKLLTGWFGNVDAWAVNGFETLVVGPITTMEGDTRSGDVSFGSGYFGTPR